MELIILLAVGLGASIAAGFLAEFLHRSDWKKVSNWERNLEMFLFFGGIFLGTLLGIVLGPWGFTPIGVGFLAYVLLEFWFIKTRPNYWE